MLSCSFGVVEWGGGKVTANKPRSGERIKHMGLLAVDTLTQDGGITANDSQSVGDLLGILRREICAWRREEIKLQTTGFMDAGSLLGRRV